MTTTQVTGNTFGLGNHRRYNAQSGVFPMLLLGILILVFPVLLCGQSLNGSNDTIPRSPASESVEDQEFTDKHSPLRATMLSAALPGLGQIYNGRIWKAPIVYAGFGVAAYYVNFNNSRYQLYRRAWVARVDGNPNTVDDFPSWSPDRLQRATNFYRRNLELTYIIAVGLYVLNILDATVDAHLLDFDVSEDLTVKLRPSIQSSPGNFSLIPGNGASAGIKLTFNF